MASRKIRKLSPRLSHFPGVFGHLKVWLLFGNSGTSLHQSSQTACFSQFFKDATIKGLHIMYRGYITGNIYKKLLQKVLALSEEHDKKTLPAYNSCKKKFVSRMLKKFLYLNGKVLLLCVTLDFQKEINSKRHAPFMSNLTTT